MAPVSFNRRRRDREFEHYFEPFAPHAPAHFFEPADFSQSATKPVPSIYPGLFNLAQLSALRFNVRRAIVSLISSDSQYIVAEATRTISSTSLVFHDDPDDGLVFGHTVVPRHLSLCFKSLSNKTAQDCVEPDLTAPGAPDVSHLPAVLREKLRAYAGVPIYSPASYPIGVLALLDDVPRPDLSTHHLQGLRNIAADVARHITDMRTGMDHARHVRMVNGISALVSGRTSIRAKPDQLREGNAHNHCAFEGQLNREQDEDKSQIHMLASQVRRLKRVARPNRQRDSPTEHQTPGSIDASNQLSYFERSQTSPTSPSSVTPFPADTVKVASEANPSRPSPASRQGSSRWSDQNGVDELFARASNIIREAMEVEGVIFLSSDSLQSSSHALEESSPPESDESTASHTHSGPCSTAGFSTSSSSSINGDTAPEYARRFPASLLAGLVGHFPSGKHLHPVRYYEPSSGSEMMEDVEDSDSDIQQSNAGQQDLASGLDIAHRPTLSAKGRSEGVTGDRRTGRMRRVRRNLIKGVLTQIEGAHSMLYFPLWDTQTDTWYAAVFVWTQRPNRVFSHTDLHFLSAFASNVMTEVLHLRALNTERIKSNFVSTISHELRSPLHGLVGCTEALQQTALNLYQADMLSGIKACGTTLMGTVNNLLDHARINHMQDRPPSESQTMAFSNGGGEKSFTSGLKMDQQGLDMAEITEEIVQSCVTGFEMSSYASLSMQNARVVVDVQHGSSWRFALPYGAWTRIITNLVDNALKFTKDGFVYIRLYCVSVGGEETDLEIKLEVIDTGVGMSKSFVQKQLYRAFEQEDPQSSGTGLGLSIVHHVVSSIGGLISIDTEQSKGTSTLVRVSASRQAPTERPADAGEDFLAKALECSRGLRVALVDFGAALPFDACQDQVDLDRSKAAALEARVLENMCRNWFHMEVIQPDDDETIPDIVIQNTTPGAAVTRPSVSGVVATVSICNSKAVDLPADSREHHFLTRPVTVRKFARALAAWKTAADEAAITPPDDDGPSDFTAAPASGSQEANVDATSERSDSRRTSGSDNRLVLAVDDNELNLKLLVGVMKRLKVKHMTATNGAEAVAVFREHRAVISHIFMDISMPVMDGLEATRQIRRIERESENVPRDEGDAGAARAATKIIALTGLGSKSAQDQARSAGVDIYMTKPVKLQKLREVL